ncbi:hypothetical protein FTX61_10600 [Nitriliruptoraceae bacterium ZYF776]|nr:hypothetical protein [Profundirhabdus halotolerans]
MNGTNLLAVLLWSGAGAGVLVVFFALMHRSRRRIWLLIAALLFLPIGILGILSVGAYFLAAAALCLVGAVLSRPSTLRTSEPTP